ncbi:MAG: hypothetical protein K0Q95_707 [Bacteroidota bacterium]|nr:hypothetical protein [Bacteroidota bacterium]
MKKIYFLIICVLVVSSVKSQTWEWLQDFETNQYALIEIDAQGNSYTLFQYKNSITELSNSNSYADSALHTRLIKRDAHNNLQWEKELFCTGLSRIRITLKNNSTAYLTGEFSGNLSCDNFSLNSNGGCDIVLIQIDNSGNFSLNKHFGGAGDERGTCAFDSRGYLIVTGGYTNSGTFGNLIYTGNTSQDFFLLQYDTNGNLLWSERAVTPNSGGYCVGSKIKTDIHNNIYVTISGDALLENNGVQVGAYYAEELCKFNSGGLYRHTYDIGSWYPLGYQQGWEVDNEGNVYYASVAGTYHTPYVSRIVMQDSLAQIIWQNNYGTGDYGRGDFYITGFHLDTQGHYFFTAEGDSLVGNTTQMIVKGNAGDGSIIWKYYQDITHPQFATIRTDNNNNLYVASSFRDTLSIGSSSIYSLTNIFFNPFIVKLAAEPIGINEFADASAISIFPNPSSGQFALGLTRLQTNSNVCIRDVLGNSIYNEKATSPEQIIDLSGKAKGVYFIEVQTGNEKVNRKIILN